MDGGRKSIGQPIFPSPTPSIQEKHASDIPSKCAGIALRSAADMNGLIGCTNRPAPGAYSKALETGDFASPVLPRKQARMMKLDAKTISGLMLPDDKVDRILR